MYLTLKSSRLSISLSISAAWKRQIISRLSPMNLALPPGKRAIIDLNKSQRIPSDVVGISRLNHVPENVFLIISRRVQGGVEGFWIRLKTHIFRWIIYIESIWIVPFMLQIYFILFYTRFIIHSLHVSNTILTFVMVIKLFLIFFILPQPNCIMINV